MYRYTLPLRRLAHWSRTTKLLAILTIVGIIALVVWINSTMAAIEQIDAYNNQVFIEEIIK